MQRLESCVSQECDIYLLDDVLAAVDASVAALLWERAICGLLRSKTRLVRPCLSGPGYLEKRDHIGHAGMNWHDGHVFCWLPADCHLLTARESDCHNLYGCTAYASEESPKYGSPVNTYRLLSCKFLPRECRVYIDSYSATA